MPDWLLIIWSDLKDSILAFTVRDLTRPSFFGLWLVILLMPLIGVDRRDPVAGMVYVVFALGAGAALVFALPKDLVDEPSIQTIFWSMVLMGIASSVRWVWGRR